MVKSYYWLTLCVVIWGSNFVFGKILVEFFSPSLLTTLRLLFILLFLLGIAFFTKEKRTTIEKRDIGLLIILGIVGVFINQWSFFVGLATVDPTTAALILALTPILTGFLAAIFLKEKVTARMVAGSLLAMVGIFYVVTGGSLTLMRIDKGLVWMMLTMVTFALMIIMSRSLVPRISPFYITVYSNIVGFIISIPFAFLYDEKIVFASEISPWLLLIATAIIVHGLANLVWNIHIQYVKASKASILSNLEPFVAMIVGFILLAKPIQVTEILGGILIVFGVVFSTYQRKKVVKIEPSTNIKSRQKIS